MKQIHPLDYELNEAKRITELIAPNCIDPVFIIYVNPKFNSLTTNIFAKIFTLLRQKGVKVASHDIYTETAEDLQAYLKIQNKDVLLFHILMHNEFPKNGLIEFPKILFDLGYSVITCCPHCTDLEDLDKYKKILNNIGYNVKIIKEKPFKIMKLFDYPSPSKEALKYSYLAPIYECNLDTVQIDLENYNYLKEFAGNTQHDAFKSLKDGIYKVNTDKEVAISELFSILSMMECCWEARLITKEAFENRVIAYLYIENGYVKGYVAFEEKSPSKQVKNNKQTFYILVEVYTCPQFRRKGISSKLIDFAIEDLNIDTTKLFVSGPVMPAAQKIIAERVDELIILEEETALKTCTKDEIEKMWGIF